ncbi:MAG: response regulator [Spirochaetota bacterium]|nr:response regulator [Spirochaetota bacterium]
MLEIIKTFVQHIKDRVSFDILSVTLIQGNDLVQYPVSTSDDNIRISPSESYSMEQSYVITCLSTEKPILNNILKDSYSENKIFKEALFKSAVHFPVFINGRIIGTLDIISSKKKNYKNKDIKSLIPVMEEIMVHLANQKQDSDNNQQVSDPGATDEALDFSPDLLAILDQAEEKIASRDGQPEDSEAESPEKPIEPATSPESPEDISPEATALSAEAEESIVSSEDQPEDSEAESPEKPIEPATSPESPEDLSPELLGILAQAEEIIASSEDQPEDSEAESPEKPIEPASSPESPEDLSPELLGILAQAEESIASREGQPEDSDAESPEKPLEPAMSPESPEDISSETTALSDDAEDSIVPSEDQPKSSEAESPEMPDEQDIHQGTADESPTQTETPVIESPQAEYKHIIEKNIEHFEGNVSLVGPDYRIRYISNDFRRRLNIDPTRQPCYVAYNKSGQICPGCPVKSGLLSPQTLKNHVVTTELKDGKKELIFFALAELNDGTKGVIEFFKDSSLLKVTQEEEPLPVKKEEPELAPEVIKDAPDEIHQFIDHGTSQIRSPITSLINYIHEMEQIPYQELSEVVFRQKLTFMHNTLKHMNIVNTTINQALKDKVSILRASKEIQKEEEPLLPAVKEKKLLIVDPMDKSRTDLYRFLSKLGYHVLQAKDGLEGIMLTKKQLPDIILLEINIPRVNGLLFLEKTREHISKNIPCIIVSNNKNPEIIEHAYHLGAMGYFSKKQEDQRAIAQLIYDILSENAKTLPAPKVHPDTQPAPHSLEESRKPVENQPKVFGKGKFISTDEAIGEIADLHNIPNNAEFIAAQGPDRVAPPAPPVEDSSQNQPESPATAPEIQENMESPFQTEISVEEKEGGAILDFGKSAGMTHSVFLDEDIATLKLTGYLSGNGMEQANEEFFKLVGSQKESKRKLIIDLRHIIPESLSETVLDSIFTFRYSFPTITPRSARILSTNPEVTATIANHPTGGKYNVHSELEDAFGLLHMEV